jgi:predicted oxidoreductase
MFRLLAGVFLWVAVLAGQTRQPDVVVVGAGIAGLTTALEAARGGATVAVVDIASVFGGHAVVSEGGLSLIGTPLQEKLGQKDSPDLAYQDFLRWGEDPNTAWVRMYVDRSRRDIYDWMSGLGVQFDALTLIPGNSVARFHRNPRRGYGLVEPVYRECLKTGKIVFHWNTRITGLLRQEDRINGVEGLNERTGAPFRLSGKAVVIATGGFQSNLDLVKENWPKDKPFPSRLLIGSGINALGSGLELARSAGALIERLDHQWNYPQGVPDPRYPGMNRGINFLNPVAVWVNGNGQRFVNEESGSAAILKEMLKQPGGRGWQVFDSTARDSLRVAGTDWADPKRVDALILNNPNLVHKADTLPQLAQKAGWPVEPFLAAVAGFNKALANGTDPDFERFNPGNPPSARVGRPAIRAVAVPPFYAAPVYPMTRKSMGGIAVDLECRALNVLRQPIPGLYAAGEVTGFNGLNGRAGLEGTFIGPSILQGRILGRNLAKLADGQAPSRLSSAANANRAAPLEAPCVSCHAIAKELATSRKGYWHFEHVHRIVLDRAWNCDSCHAELAPFNPSQHKIDPVAQIAACARCHLGTE